MLRMQIPFHRRRGSPRYRILTLEEQSLPWHPAGGAGRPSAAGAQLTRTEQPVRFPQNSRGVRRLVKKRKKRGNQTDLSAEPSVAVPCRSSIFPAAAEVQPSERTRFHLTAHVSVINAKTSRNPPIDHRGPTDVQQRRETSRRVWPLSLVKGW